MHTPIISLHTCNYHMQPTLNITVKKQVIFDIQTDNIYSFDDLVITVSCLVSCITAGGINVILSYIPPLI